MGFFGGSADEVYRIQVEANDAEVKRLKDAIEQEEAALKKLISSFGMASQAQIKSDSEVKAYTASIKNLNRELASVGGSGGGLDQIGNGAGKAGQKLVNLGRMFDDLQYVPQQGLRPIINNVMEMVPAIGMAMIAVQLLITNWDSFSKLIGMGATKTEAERMDELAKSTSRTADETARLVKYKEQQATIESQRTSKTSTQKNQAKGVNEAVAETGVDSIVKGLVETNRRGMINGDPEAGKLEAAFQTQVKGLRMSTNYAMGQKEAESALSESPEMKALETRLDQLARTQIADAANSPSKLEDLRNKVAKNPKAFGKGGADLLSQLNASSATGQAQDKALEAFQKDSASDANLRMKADDQKEKEAKELTKSLNEQGKASEEAMNLERDNKKKALKDQVDAGKDSGVMEPLKNLMMHGLSKDEAAKILAPSFGKEAAGLLADDAHGAAQRGLAHEAIQQANQKGPNSETVGSMEFARKIQSGVSPDKTLEKQLATMNASRELLAQIVKNTTAAKNQAPVLGK
jgi:hypothetical protein